MMRVNFYFGPDYGNPITTMNFLWYLYNLHYNFLTNSFCNLAYYYIYIWKFNSTPNFFPDQNLFCIANSTRICKLYCIIYSSYYVIFIIFARRTHCRVTQWFKVKQNFLKTWLCIPCEQSGRNRGIPFDLSDKCKLQSCRKSEKKRE